MDVVSYHMQRNSTAIVVVKLYRTVREAFVHTTPAHSEYKTRHKHLNLYNGYVQDAPGCFRTLIKRTIGTGSAPRLLQGLGAGARVTVIAPLTNDHFYQQSNKFFSTGPEKRTNCPIRRHNTGVIYALVFLFGAEPPIGNHYCRESYKLRDLCATVKIERENVSAN